MSEMLTKNFSRKELECPCCGLLPKPDFMARLQALRDLYGSPLKVTSGARCAAYNQKIGGAKDSQHVKGLAVDVSITSGPGRYWFLECAFKLGFTGIGLAKTFIHLDTREGASTTWFY